MYKLILCEGSNELKIIDILLDNNCFNFTRDNLVGLRPYEARQLKPTLPFYDYFKIIDEEIEILRVGDKQKDTLRIPKEINKDKISIRKYCTLPELEMLLIISCNMVDEYNKSCLKPKVFAKKNIKNNKKNYDNSTKFYEKFYSNHHDLIAALKEYKRIKKHKNDELFLYDLISIKS